MYVDTAYITLWMKWKKKKTEVMQNNTITISILSLF